MKRSTPLIELEFVQFLSPFLALFSSVSVSVSVSLSLNFSHLDESQFYLCVYALEMKILANRATKCVDLYAWTVSSSQLVIVNE